jgi:hypothetical protein
MQEDFAKVATTFPAKEEKTLSDVIYYLLQLHPRLWRVLESPYYPRKMNAYANGIWGSTYPYGNIRPLFATRSTNSPEGVIKAALWNSLRTKTPRDGMYHYFLRVLDIFHIF